MSTRIKTPSNTTIRKRVCALLDMTEEQYCEVQFDAGIGYLAHVYKDYPPVYDYCVMDGRSGFWPWWRRQWALREHVWLLTLNPPGMQLLYSQKEPHIFALFVDERMQDILCRLWQRCHKSDRIDARFIPKKPLHL
jgi:hypothetical protein